MKPLLKDRLRSTAPLGNSFPNGCTTSGNHATVRKLKPTLMEKHSHEKYFTFAKNKYPRVKSGLIILVSVNFEIFLSFDFC